jgi:hypothetical protein
MIKKTVILKTMAAVLAVIAVSCASAGSAAADIPLPAEGVSLDAAIKESAEYFSVRFPGGTRIAVTGIEADSIRLSDYIAEELWNHFEQSGKFTMIDRQNLARIQEELIFQASGLVDDESARSIGRLHGAEIIVYGRISPADRGRRMTLYASEVERGVSSQQAKTVLPDPRWDAPPGDYNLDAEIDRAVLELGRSLGAQIAVGMGRISLEGGGTVTDLSDFLKRRIAYSASRMYTKFRVQGQSAEYAGQSSAADGGFTGALIGGSFSALDGGAEVLLQLVSAGGEGRTILGTGKFFIPEAELHRRGLSVLPPRGDGVITKTEFEEKQKALAPYEGAYNAFGLELRPNDLDGVYYDGEYMNFFITAKRDCYFKITHVDVYGNSRRIYPLDRRDNNFLRAGERRLIPDNARYRLNAPFGEEYILIAAYERPFNAGAEPAAPVSRESVSRGLTVESPEGPAVPAATAMFSYTILPRPQGEAGN